jgi:hypothetical protein
MTNSDKQEVIMSEYINRNKNTLAEVAIYASIFGALVLGTVLAVVLHH